MNTLKWLGLFCLAGGLIVLGYQGLEALMSQTNDFVNYNLIGIFGKETFELIDQVPGAPIRDGLDYVINMHLYSLLLIVGAIFLVISGIFGKR